MTDVIPSENEIEKLKEVSVSVPALNEVGKHVSKASTLLLVTFVFLIASSVMSLASTCTVSPSAPIAIGVGLVGFILGFFASDYPVGEDKASKKHARAFFSMLLPFGLAPFSTVLLHWLAKQPLTGLRHIGILGVMGHFGHSVARVAVNDQSLSSHNMHIGWHATTLTFSILTFVMSFVAKFAGTETCPQMT